MKKNVLALSITAALVGLTGSAHAMTNLGGAPATTVGLTLNQNGVGHSLFVPYYSAQNGNATLINLVNTDTVNGKAVKVRFRGAANSDDVFDFQVFLSPGDVWTGMVSQGATGAAQLTTNDASCTKPSKAVLNSTPFITSRLDSTMTAANRANGTREGYVEIFNMGDIPPLKADVAVVADLAGSATAGVDADAAVTANPLFTAIKHVAKVAPCGGAAGSTALAAWTYLDNNNLTYNAGAAAATTPRSAGLLPPTTGLTADWMIVNTANYATWSGQAVAVQASTAAGAAAPANVVYWPQTSTAVGAGNISTFTADPLLRRDNVYFYDTVLAAYTADATPAVTAAYYDMPDMSTPYFNGATPLTQALALTTSLATTSVSGEFYTDPATAAATDWVFSLPTRRYSVALDYAANAAAVAGDNGRRFTDLTGAGTFTVGTEFFDQTNTTVVASATGNGSQVCVRKAAMTASPTDREETTPATPAAAVVISPSTPTAPSVLTICGEAAVLSINYVAPAAGAFTGAVSGNVASKNMDVGYQDGWLKIATPASLNAAGLPVVGSVFFKAYNSAAKTQGFGAAFKYRNGL